MIRRLTTVQLVVDIALAAVFVLIALPVEFSLGAATVWNDAVTPLLCLLFGAALALRRLSPALALGLSWAGAIVQMGFTRPPGFVDLVVFAVLYAAAAYGARPVFWLGFASAVLGATVGTVYIFTVLSAGSFQLDVIPTAVFVLIAAMFALLLAWTVGALTRTAARARQDRRAQQQAQAEVAAEQERARIARDMHDVVAHSLAVVIAQADGARYAAASDPGAQTAALTTISTTARAALADVRVLLAQLRHRQEDGPQPTIADLAELFERMRAAGLDVHATIAPPPPADPPAAVQLAVYRILQEALTNALRHGGGAAVTARIGWHDDHVELEVRNPVEGSTGRATAGGHGLIGMRERALLVGGELEAGTDRDAFRVRARLPLRGAA